MQEMDRPSICNRANLRIMMSHRGKWYKTGYHKISKYWNMHTTAHMVYTICHSCSMLKPLPFLQVSQFFKVSMEPALALTGLQSQLFAMFPCQRRTALLTAHHLKEFNQISNTDTNAHASVTTGLPELSFWKAKELNNACSCGLVRFPPPHKIWTLKNLQIQN